MAASRIVVLLLAVLGLACAATTLRGAAEALPPRQRLGGRVGAGPTMASLVKRAEDAGECDLVHTDVATGISTAVVNVPWCSSFPNGPSTAEFDYNSNEIMAVVPNTPYIVAINAETGAVRNVAEAPSFDGDQIIGAAFVNDEFYIVTPLRIAVVNGDTVDTLLETNFPFDEGAVASDGENKIWVAQWNSTAVYEVSVATKSMKIAFQGQPSPKALEYDAETGGLVELAAWKLFAYTTSGAVTQLGAIPGAGGPLYLHPRALTLSPDGSIVTIVDFTTMHITDVASLPTWLESQPFTFGGTRIIGKSPLYIKY